MSSILYIRGKTYNLKEQLAALGGVYTPDLKAYTFTLPALADYKERNGEDAFGLLTLLAANPEIILSTSPNFQQASHGNTQGHKAQTTTTQYKFEPTECPDCGSAAALRFSRKDSAYYCYKAIGGCGANHLSREDVKPKEKSAPKHQE